MAFDIQARAPLVKAAWWWSGDTYATQDELNRMMAGRNPLEVAELARRHGVPVEYIMGNLPDRTFMTGGNAEAYGNFLKDLNKLKWIGKDTRDMDITKWDPLAAKHGKQSMELIRDENGNILPLNQQYLYAKHRMAELDGRLNWDRQRLQQAQQFNKDLGLSQDVGTVSKNFDLKNYIPVYEQEARTLAREHGVPADKVEDFVKAYTDEARKHDTAEMQRLSAFSQAVNNVHPEMRKIVDDARHNGYDGGSYYDHIAASAAGARNGQLTSSIAGRAADMVGLKADDPWYKKMLLGWTADGAALADSATVTMPGVRANNKASTGNANTHGDNPLAQTMNMRMYGNTGGRWNAMGGQAALDAAVVGLNAATGGGVGVAAGMGKQLAKWTMPKVVASAEKTFSKVMPSVLSKQVVKGSLPGWAVNTGFIGAQVGQGVASKVDNNRYFGENGVFSKSLERTMANLENNRQPTANDLANSNYAEQVQATAAEAEHNANNPNSQLAPGTLGPMHMRGEVGDAARQPSPQQQQQAGGTAWYKNPWVWAAGGAGLLGGGLLLKNYLDKRRRAKQKKQQPPQRRVVPPRVMPRQSMVPYDYQQEQPMNVGYYNSDNDPFDMFTGDYYY